MDEYGVNLQFSYDKARVAQSFLKIKREEFDLSSIKNLMGMPLGINAFDLYIFKAFIEYFKIQRITELGAGSSSIFLDKLGVKRSSFALSSQEYQVDYHQCNIRESMDKILVAAKDSDMLLIDAEHSSSFAEFYFSGLLEKTSIPIFIHDWFLPGELGYTEQVQLLSRGLLEKYNFQIMTRQFCIQIYDNSNIPPCSIILRK